MFFIKRTESKYRWIKNLVQKRGRRSRVEMVESRNIDNAVKYFNTAYPPIYGERSWSAIKSALFREKKYGALINNFSTTEPTTEKFENLGAYNIGEFYTKNVKRYNRIQTNMDQIQEQNDSNIEDTLKQPSERPKLYNEMSDEEKAIESAKPPIGIYPQEYKERLAAAGIDVGVDPSELTANMADRLITGHHMKDSQLLSMQNFVPATKLMGLEDWIEETDVFVGATEEDSEIGINKVREPNALEWPENIKLYSFIRGDFNAEFPQPKRCPHFDVLTHFLMGGASILPVLALNLQRGESVLDMCAAPGGKSLAILQSMMPDELLCCDVKPSRVDRIDKIMNQYIPKDLEDIWDIVTMEKRNGVVIEEPNTYDKVLVDVPCINDRHSLNDGENSIFKSTRMAERNRLPEFQADLLYAAINMCRPGGSVVYSTCTLSPLQNDGAVRLALAKIWKTTRIECDIVDLENTLKHLKFAFKFGTKLGLRYGHIVVPSTDENFGPMYFAKINRIK